MGDYMTLDEWKDKVKFRGYAHFDRKTTLHEVWDYISNPSKIKNHGFLPFIHHTLKITKYSKANGKTTKKREICYSAHKDRYIYQYYAYLLNEEYNKRVANDGLDQCSIAYRNNLHMNNIHFAKRAFDKIKELKECYVVIGDFKNFFDNLDHQYLKKRMCDLLQKDTLPDDYYAVFKNITKYSTWELSELLKESGLLLNVSGIRKLNKLDLVVPWSKFKALKKDKVTPNKESFGIPQGSAISAVLSNIYMLEFDSKINSYVSSKDGMYMRYSDDFIVILPIDKALPLDQELASLMSIIHATPSLVLEPVKTQLFEYIIGNIDSFEIRDALLCKTGKSRIDYLGFSFDGNAVTIRDKTISKYYNKLNWNIKKILISKDDSKTKVIIKSIRLYRKFGYHEHEDSKDQKNRNFLSYVDRAERIFGTTERVNVVKSRHIQMIRKKLKNHESGRS
jgi:hypothetical protein